MTDQENRLAILEQADKLLAEIKTVDDARHIAATADAARAYAKELNLGLDVENRAMEIKIWAQYSAGGILLEMEKRGELRTDGSRKETSSTERMRKPSAIDLGFSRHNAELCRYLNRQDRQLVSEGVRDIWDAEIPLSSWGVLRYIQNKNKEKQPQKSSKTKEDLFTEVKDAIQVIKDNITILESADRNGGGERYYLRWIYRALTEIVIYLSKKGYQHADDPEG